eukprot:TRINITY_DN58833_c0_g1_i1.p1 TRINITY_DN58833_c0_g1~~TRINITY_DN58833_c0_g1_i1.p1  ORF type:complete len:325 (+),score=66.03 TRINITY_DN58833_c0_g1_i1:114-1088(+)
MSCVSLGRICKVLGLLLAQLLPSQARRLGDGDCMHGERLGQKTYHQDIADEFKCVDCVMRNAGRDYVITEGALLGTARNGFLLPWDSDGDFSFDVRGADGKEDVQGFYKLFSEKGMIKTKANCSLCGTVTMAHFIGDQTREEQKIHPWQTYDDIVSGSLLASKGSSRVQVPKTQHLELLELLTRAHDSRIFVSSEPGFVRDGGGGYIDVEPFFTNQDKHGDNRPGMWHNLAISAKVDDVLPSKRCQTLHFAEAGVNTLELNCPANPNALLQEYYGSRNWQNVPYNKYDDKKETWMLDRSPHAPSLQEYMAQKYKYTGPFKPVLK